MNSEKERIDQHGGKMQQLQSTTRATVENESARVLGGCKNRIKKVKYDDEDTSGPQLHQAYQSTHSGGKASENGLGPICS